MNYESLSDYFNSLPEEHREIIKEFNRIKIRFSRHGADITNTRGRKRVSEEHKKETRKAYYKKKNEEEKQRKIENGTYRPVGRPKKIIVN